MFAVVVDFIMTNIVHDTSLITKHKILVISDSCVLLVLVERN